MEHEVHEIESSISIAEEVLERSEKISSARARLAELESSLSFTARQTGKRETLFYPKLIPIPLSAARHYQRYLPARQGLNAMP